MELLQTITHGEALTAFGLFLNILGVYALTVSSVIGKKPAQTWWYLWQHVDRDNPEDAEEEKRPVDQFGPVGGGMATTVPPPSSSTYDSVYRMARGQTLGVSALFLGFGFQLIGTLV